MQVLQDMIGDLTSAPEPVQIKLFSQDPALLEAGLRKSRTPSRKFTAWSTYSNGIENTISGPATTFQINPSIAARAGFTPEEIATDAAAILEGEPAAAPVVSERSPYTVRVRFPAGNRASLEAMRNTLLTSSTGKPRHWEHWPRSPSFPGKLKFAAKICSAMSR